ncbi:unnamed protein product, partial [Didymodactylos carnosus]
MRCLLGSPTPLTAPRRGSSLAPLRGACGGSSSTPPPPLSGGNVAELVAEPWKTLGPREQFDVAVIDGVEVEPAAPVT